MKKFWTALGTVIALGCMTNAAESILPPSPVIGGYYEVGGNYESYPCTRINPGYNIIYDSFLTFDSAGEITFQPNPEVVKHGHQSGKLVLISLGTSPFVELTKTPEKLADYVSKVVKHVDQYDYDGIDVDWEHPTKPEQGVQWSALMKSFRNELDALGKKKGRKMYLTTALPPGPWAWQYNDFAVMRDCLDYINVMCYDLDWGTANYHAPLYANPADPKQISCVEELKFLEQKVGYPRSKTIIGLPFYGTYFETDQPFAKITDFNKRFRQLGYADVMKLSDGFKRGYDVNSAGAWAWSQDQKTLIIYDSPRSIYDKTQQYLRLGYGGVFCWAINRDLLPDDTQPLTEAMMQAVRDFCAHQLK